MARMEFKIDVTAVPRVWVITRGRYSSVGDSRTWEIHSIYDNEQGAKLAIKDMPIDWYVMAWDFIEGPVKPE
jgi:hypothetical protein